jgi:hypothetical protein
MVGGGAGGTGDVAGVTSGDDGVVEPGGEFKEGKCAELISPIPTKKSSSHRGNGNVT